MLKITSKKEITIYLILMLIYLTVAFSYGKLAFNEKYTERSLTSLEQVCFLTIQNQTEQFDRAIT